LEVPGSHPQVPVYQKLVPVWRWYKTVNRFFVTFILVLSDDVGISIF
jgi:hypothetical protein